MNEKIVYIAGSNCLFNELICYSLQKEISISCRTVVDISELFSLCTYRKDALNLLMLDASGEEVKDHFPGIEQFSESMRHTSIPALFNLSRDMGIERLALKHGVRGFFYREENFSQLLKGIQALFAGEIWLSRNVLLEVALNNSLAMDGVHIENYRLTHREIEILTHLCAGASNDEISERLCISSHTVKAHLYNIYKKINVENRFQAALWAAKHL